MCLNSPTTTFQGSSLPDSKSKDTLRALGVAAVFFAAPFVAAVFAFPFLGAEICFGGA